MMFLGEVESRRDPFPYFIASKAFDAETATKLLEWLETKAPWRDAKKSFYELCEFDFRDAELPETIAPMFETEYLESVKHRVEGIFSVKFHGSVTASAHKILPGQGVGIHTDFVPENHRERPVEDMGQPPGRETHRVVVQLNHAFTDAFGGHLLFFNSNKTSDIHRILRPIHNTAVGFALTRNSYHAVSNVRDGVRNTIVYSFWEE
jgi:2OG-Fe(II) oxygenase superfamily